MKVIEFQGRLVNGAIIQVPVEVARELSADSPVRIMLLWNSGEDPDWPRLSSEHFGAAYAPEDAVYDARMDVPPSR